MDLVLLPDADAWAETIVQEVVEGLSDAIDARGQASLALPGGSTPLGFLPALARCPLDWSCVLLTLTDERLVPTDHPDSNEGLLCRHLLATLPVLPRFVALDERALGAAPWPLDVAVVGMGEDGHVASLFPGSAALDDPAPLLVAVSGRPPADRVSLSLVALAAARRILLCLRGARKMAVLEQVIAGYRSDLPVAHLLERTGERVRVFATLG